MLSIRETNKLSLAAISIGYSKDNAVLRKLLENSIHRTLSPNQQNMLRHTMQM